jgi:serine/threonine protein kinase
MRLACPDRTELSSLVLGKLPSEDIDQLAEHVEGCQACQEMLSGLNCEDDALVFAMTHRKEVTPFEQEPALALGLEKIIALGIPARQQPSSGASPQNVPDVIRDYQVLAPLGRGGMGNVYKALHTRLEKLVALKILPTDRISADAVARFQREMKAVGKLHHPNIVQAFDAGEHEGQHFLVMELIDGVDLSAIIHHHGSLPVADACELIRQAAVALEYVRQQGMVHRDVKPSNLMLNSGGQLKLLDLGLALLHDPTREGDQLTALGSTMGTADYVAPEQTGDSHNVDIRADIYSLGCTLFKLLTGRGPFSAPKYRSSLQKIIAHRTEPFPDIRVDRPDVSAELKSIIDRMVAKQPDQRYATPAQVASVLEPFCAGNDLSRITAIEAAGTRTDAEMTASTFVSNATSESKQNCGSAAAQTVGANNKTPAQNAIGLTKFSWPLRLILVATGLLILIAVVAKLCSLI